MLEVRSAIHIRTGQRALVELIDAWLLRHGAQTLPFADVYAACVHLLKHYEDIPDLVLFGADWAAADEFNIVSYIRQTWSRTPIVVYSADGETPLFDLLPLVLTCRGDVAVQRVLAASPTDLVRRLCAELAPVTLYPAQPDLPPARPTPVESAPAGARPALVRPGRTMPRTDAPTSVLTPEELSALLDTSEEG